MVVRMMMTDWVWPGVLVWLVSSHQPAVLHTWQPCGIQMGPAHLPANHSPAAELSTNREPGGMLRRGQIVMVADPSVTPADSGLVRRERLQPGGSSVATQHFHLSWRHQAWAVQTITNISSLQQPPTSQQKHKLCQINRTQIPVLAPVTPRLSRVVKGCCQLLLLVVKKKMIE